MVDCIAMREVAKFLKCSVPYAQMVCRCNGVTAFADIRSGRIYVLRLQFLRAFLGPLLPNLQRIFKDRWVDVLDLLIAAMQLRYVAFGKSYTIAPVFGKRDRCTLGEIEHNYFSTLIDGL